MSDQPQYEGYSNETMSWRDLLAPVVLVGLFIGSFWGGPLVLAILFGLIWVVFSASIVRGILWRRKRVADGELKPLPRYASIALGIRTVCMFIAAGLYTVGYWMAYRGEAPATADNLRTLAFALIFLNFVLQFGTDYQDKKKSKRPD